MQNMCSVKSSLQIKSEQEVLYIACEMERRAIRVYERGLMLCHDPALKAMLSRLHGDETMHLAKFAKMGNASIEATDQEQQILLKSYAAQILFPGGLMQAQREGALSSMEALLAFARDSEATAVCCYEEFAQNCEREDVRDAFLAIAREEQAHLAAIEDQMK